jgi:hypothetical protein
MTIWLFSAEEPFPKDVVLEEGGKNEIDDEAPKAEPVVGRRDRKTGWKRSTPVEHDGNEEPVKRRRGRKPVEIHDEDKKDAAVLEEGKNEINNEAPKAEPVMSRRGRKTGWKRSTPVDHDGNEEPVKRRRGRKPVEIHDEDKKDATVLEEAPKAEPVMSRRGRKTGWKRSTPAKHDGNEEPVKRRRGRKPVETHHGAVLEEGENEFDVEAPKAEPRMRRRGRKKAVERNDESKLEKPKMTKKFPTEWKKPVIVKHWIVRRPFAQEGEKNIEFFIHETYISKLCQYKTCAPATINEDEHVAEESDVEENNQYDEDWIDG